MMKKTFLLTVFIVFLMTAPAVFSQTEEMTLIMGINDETPAGRLVWDESGNWVTGVSRSMYQQTRIEPEPMVQADGSSFGAYSGQSFSFGDRAYSLTTVSPSGSMAALSSDYLSLDVLTQPMDPDKAPLSIQPGFMILSAALSDDGRFVLANSAEEIRTVVYSTADGGQVYDLNGFETAAPVYDSILSADGTRVIWHSRGTFAVQDVETGKFGETISLWDFASAYAFAPDDQTLAVSIINDDYENGAVIFFDPQSGAEKGRVITGKTAPYELSYSADGSVLLAADRDTLYWIDGKSFELLSWQTVVTGDSDELRVSRIAASPDGSQAAVLLSSNDLYLVRKP